MKKYILLLVTLLLIFSGCASLNVNSDYDTSFNMKSLKKFYILQNESERKDTLTFNRIDSAVTDELTLKGYESVAKLSADFLVYYHINITNKTQIISDYQMAGMYPYRYGGMMMSTTRSYNYDEGQLIVDMIDPKDKNIIYRISVKDEIKSFDTPQERTKYINEVIKTLLKDFPVKI